MITNAIITKWLTTFSDVNRNIQLKNFPNIGHICFILFSFIKVLEYRHQILLIDVRC